MKYFNRLLAAVVVFIVLCFFVVNRSLLSKGMGAGGRPYRVEAGRIAREIEQHGLAGVDVSDYSYITGVERYSGSEQDKRAFFEDVDSDYVIRQIGGETYRIEYTFSSERERKSHLILVNGTMGVLALSVLMILLFVRQRLLKPFFRLSDVPYELSRGNLTVPLKENKSRFFGRFVWGVNLLREHIEQQKERELELQREKKTLILSISHDIKTPLSAIKLYAKALCRGLYQDAAKQKEIAGSIDKKADEIEAFVFQIIKASNEDFLDLEVTPGEFYLSELLDYISDYYREKLSLLKIPFSIKHYDNCLLKGDRDRSIEVLQNIIENAVKYGDGSGIEVNFSEEEECQLVTVKNRGCVLSDLELPHIFDSFWRGSNVGNNQGSGLGLYICRQIMHRMDGEIYAEIQEDCMLVTVFFRRAG